MTVPNTVAKLDAWQTIEYLRSEKGSTVEIPCDNPDGPMFVECFGPFTHWKPERFEGEDVFECLSSARDAMQAFEGKDDVEEVALVDPKTFELAKHFLADDAEAARDPRNAQRLAQALQQEAEDFMLALQKDDTNS